MASDTAKTLLRDFTTAGQAYEAGDQGSRLKLLELCRELTTELELPGETFMRTNWGEPIRNMALRIALELDVYKTLSSDNGSPKSAAQLAEPKGADPVLVARVMRHLSAMSSVREVARDQYAHSKYTKELVRNPAVDAFKYIADDYYQVWNSTPAWLASRSFQNPSNARDTPSASAWNAPDTTLFEYFAQNPVQGERFGAMMAMQAGGKTMWADEGAYPVRNRLGGADESEVLVVDIGGGAGHDLLGFRARHPDLKGRLVLQEMPYMIEKVKGEGACEGVVELMGHDFYGPQPVKEAHAYFFHQILHDYSDETCRQILQQIIPAMKVGTSKILINELVLPDQGANWLTTSLDLALMTCLAARERTEREFRELFESVGLVMTGIWKHPQGYDSIIEVTLAEG